MQQELTADRIGRRAVLHGALHGRVRVLLMAVGAASCSAEGAASCTTWAWLLGGPGLATPSSPHVADVGFWHQVGGQQLIMGTLSTSGETGRRWARLSGVLESMARLHVICVCMCLSRDELATLEQ